MRGPFKDAYSTLTRGLVLATCLLTVVTHFAHEKLSGMEPRIRVRARREALIDDVELCDLGPVSFEGRIAHQPRFSCKKEEGMYKLNSTLLYRVDSWDFNVENSSLCVLSNIGVLFDCGFIRTVANKDFRDRLLTQADLDGMSMLWACNESMSWDWASVSPAMTFNDTFPKYQVGGPHCAFVPPELLGKELPLSSLEIDHLGQATGQKFAHNGGVTRKRQCLLFYQGTPYGWGRPEQWCGSERGQSVEGGCQMPEYSWHT
jgi:hypothetical protein